MGFINNYLKERKKDIQQYVIIKDTKLENGDFLKKGSNFIIDFIKDNKICIHFPENTQSILNKYKEEFVTIDKLFEISMRYESDNNLHQHIEAALEDNKILSEQLYNSEQEKIHDREWYEIDKYEWGKEKEELVDTIERVNNKTNIYKKTINKLCKKYNINKKEVLNLVENIKSNEREQ
ncbi:hypothetical protein FDF76_11265 [Clostridium botulinum]|nr:hypothetical protein [Clostridium botulinum]NFI50330.1 hypothetical protein [Clostridium botulinum]NFI60266.1 hypothetical protein [Clostridium botulinum]NFI71511.1 hypothetical protein [Clostridium botulinum]NFI88518.1 hypothetical protein [Clostridium botulinum]